MRTEVIREKDGTEWVSYIFSEEDMLEDGGGKYILHPVDGLKIYLPSSNMEGIRFGAI